MSIRADQVGSSGSFGAVPVFLGTLLITAIAMAVAIPIGLMSAIYLSEYFGHYTIQHKIGDSYGFVMADEIYLVPTNYMRV